MQPAPGEKASGSRGRRASRHRAGQRREVGARRPCPPRGPCEVPGAHGAVPSTTDARESPRPHGCTCRWGRDRVGPGVSCASPPSLQWLRSLPASVRGERSAPGLCQQRQGIPGGGGRDCPCLGPLSSELPGHKLTVILSDVCTTTTELLVRRMCLDRAATAVCSLHENSPCALSYMWADAYTVLCVCYVFDKK